MDIMGPSLLSANAGNIWYDATMRVGFVVLRDPKNEESRQLSVEFLGGYWKLPMEPTDSLSAKSKGPLKGLSRTY